jgi:transposase InsO family protein
VSPIILGWVRRQPCVDAPTVPVERDAVRWDSSPCHGATQFPSSATDSLVANLRAEIRHCDGLRLDALARLALRVEPGKCELVYGAARTGPWRTVEDVELATLSWVNWRNTSRLHGYLDDEPPAEFEATF